MESAITNEYAIGDVVLVKFPFSDGAQYKPRPALVLTELDSYGDALLMGITTQQSLAEAIAISSSEALACGLSKPSVLKTTAIHAVSSRLLLQVLGKAPAGLMTKVRSQLCPRLGCN
jgi:mRNA interferase MazF